MKNKISFLYHIIFFTILFTFNSIISLANLSKIDIKKQKAKVILLSIDALRADYLMKSEDYNLKIPNLKFLMKNGTFASAVTSIFPSLTYPCHVSIITGTYPNRHGILNNKFFDPENKFKDALNDIAYHLFFRSLRLST